MTEVGDVYNSNITVSIDDFRNYAAITTNETGVALAGSQLKIGTVSGTKPQGSSSLNVERENDGNNATVNNGQAIAGVQNIIEGVYNHSYVYIANEAENMKAIVKYDGDAVAGSQTTIGVVDKSNVTIVNANEQNIAKVYGNGDAIAGGDTYIKHINNGNLNITSEALMNEAYSYNGDAIAGERVTVGSATNNSNISVSTMSMLNEAIAVNETRQQVVNASIDINSDGSGNTCY
eukprot:TRINITY_DN14901_c0_g1_i3.p1 TRINITY_DN14901_c0_g1~~TRINITY_DN14901_c0_g1_i3.p1  ORF type:complete len:266 (-),score=35.32 TRINITY_DN14901_c0_g1_i3:282-983(-)